MAERAPIRFHPLVWPVWLAAAALSDGSNPLLNLLLLPAAALVALVCHTDSPVGRAFGLFLRVGIIVILLKVGLSTIAVGGLSFGETPLGRLPRLQLPWWLGGLALGGPFTLEMVVSGLVEGIRLMTILAIFGAFNAVADHYGLLRRTPSFLGGAGLAVTIALAFVPQTITQLVAIREAQRVRGHRFRGWRDALPLLVPLVSGGLERSLQLAESMDSRGYGARTRAGRRGTLAEQVTIIAGLAVLAIGLFSIFYRPDPRTGLFEIAAASVSLAWVARSLGQASRRSRYLRDRWHRRDLAVVASSILLLAASIYLRRIAPDAFTYSPFPRAALPSFEPWSAGLVLLAIVPAALAAAGERGERVAGRRAARADR